MCCPLKISSQNTHSNKSVFSFFFYDWLVTSWTLQKQLVLFPAKQCQELFSKTSGAPKKSISIQKESSLVQNSINYPFDLTLDLKHDSSLKTKRRKMHVKWLLLLTTLLLPQMYQWWFKQLMLQFLRRNRLRHTITSFHDPQMRTLYSGAGA